MLGWLGDLRYSARALRKGGMATVFAVLALALAIGANTAAFGVLNAVVFRRVAVPDPDRLVAIRTAAFGNGDDRMPLETFERLASASRTTSAGFGWRGDYPLVNVEARGIAFAALFAEVTPGYYETLGVKPQIGRLLSPQDIGRDVAVLDYRCWERRFGRDPRVLGAAVRVGGRALTIVGITPEPFTGIEVEVAPEITAPFADKTANVAMIARLAAAATVADAQGEFESLWGALKPPAMRDRRIRVEPVSTGVSYMRGRQIRPLSALVILSALLLLLACANLANFMLARATTRTREIDVRLSLGASGWRIARLLLIEASCLAALGSALGIAFAYWAAPKLFMLSWRGVTPSIVNPRPDPRVLVVATAATVFCALIFGLTPARALLGPRRKLSGAGRPIHGFPGGRFLVSAQVALSMVLVAGSFLLLRTMSNLRTVDLGFRRDGLLLMRLFARDARTAFPARAAYYRELAERLASLPGIQGVTFSGMAPVTLGEANQKVRAGETTPQVDCVQDWVGPGFFGMMGMRVVSGREFDWTDIESAPPVAIVSQGLASRLWGRADPIGRSILIGSKQASVAGIVPDAKLWKARGDAPAAVYVPVLQDPRYNQFTVLVRASGDPLAVARACRLTLEGMGRHVPLRIESMREHENNIWAEERMLSTVSLCLGLLATLLASVGVYGIAAFGVARRVSEIGVRVALGAQRRDVYKLVLSETARMTALGLALGVPAALAVFRILRGILFGVSGTDPAILASAAAALGAVALAAAYFPARHATRIDPATALRVE